ncbi:MAG: diaminopimelate decarboxylase [Bacillota bacterium]
MKLHGTAKVNSKGNLEIGGIDVTDLVKEFGTPLIILDETLIRNNCQRFSNTLATEYKNFQLVYASKALSTPAIYRIIQEEGFGIDIVSGGELFTALASGFPSEKIFFHGNNKSSAELEMALDNQVGRFVVDNDYELILLNKLAVKKGLRPKILLRVSPGIEAVTHKYIQTGQVDSKFGFVLPNGQAIKAVKSLANYPYLDFKGIHCHIGSQIFDATFYVEATKILLAFLEEVKEETGIICQELNLGGGMGIYYTKEDNPFAIEDLLKKIPLMLMEYSKNKNYPLPKLIMEPGRAIVGNAGTTLYTIGSIKEIPGVRKYVAIDGGMSDNIRPSLYQAKYEATIANKMKLKNDELVSIAGKCCESGDVLIWDLMLQKAEHNDILAVFSTGAYSYSMSNNYNSLPRPAVIIVQNGEADLIIKRESYEQMLQNHCLPPRLQN